MPLKIQQPFNVSTLIRRPGLSPGALKLGDFLSRQRLSAGYGDGKLPSLPVGIMMQHLFPSTICGGAIATLWAAWWFVKTVIPFYLFSPYLVIKTGGLIDNSGQILVLVPGSGRNSQNIVLDAACCQVVQDGVVRKCQDTVIILDWRGCV